MPTQQWLLLLTVVPCAKFGSPATVLHVFLQGVLLWASLIIAIGPQNALVIKQGLLRQGVGAVITVCIVSDVLVVIAGTLGVGWIVERAPWALTWLRYLGVIYLLWFAWTCFKDALKPQALDVSASEIPGQRTRNPAVAAILMTWLNPAFYLDGVVMYGGLANQFGDQRWILGAGALTVTLLWFPIIGYGAQALSGSLAKPRVWQIINAVIGIIITIIAIRLGFQHI